MAIGSSVATSCRQSVRGSDVDHGTQHGTVIVRNLGSAGAFEVENPGPPIALWSQVMLQRLENGIWRDDNEAELSLAEICVWNARPSCQTLQHGGRLRPHPWNGLICGGQCPESCRANSFLGPGQFRFVVMTCNQKRRFPGPSFSLPDYDHSGLKMSQHSSPKPTAKN